MHQSEPSLVHQSEAFSCIRLIKVAHFHRKEGNQRQVSQCALSRTGTSQTNQSQRRPRKRRRRHLPSTSPKRARRLLFPTFLLLIDWLVVKDTGQVRHFLLLLFDKDDAVYPIFGKAVSTKNKIHRSNESILSFSVSFRSCAKEREFYFIPSKKWKSLPVRLSNAIYGRSVGLSI